MNKKLVIKKILAIMLLILMIINLIRPMQIFAVSGTGTWKISEQYNSSVKTTDYSTTSIYGIMMRNITNIATGEVVTAFCAEHGVDVVTGGTYSGEYYTPTNPSLKYASKIAYFGWYAKYGKYSDFNQLFAHKYDYVFTQQFIWEYLGQTSSTFRDTNIQSQYEAYKSTIISQINNMQTRPSFDATTIELNVGETKVITDNNGVLALYKSINVTHQGINFSHNYGENTLNITVNNDCTMERINISDSTTKSWGLIKDGTEDKDTTIYFNFPEKSQDQLYSLNFNDPIPLRVSLKINLLGNLELNKLNVNGDLVDGSVFTINGPGYNGDVTVTNGKIVLESIKSGTYTIKEKSAGIGYLINPTIYTVKVNPNQTTTQAIVNNEPTGELSLRKTDIDVGTDTRIDGTIHHGDACIEGAVYTLYADEDIYNASRSIKYFSANEEIATFTFDKNGIAIVNIVNNSTKANLGINGTRLTGLPLGNYYSKETTVPNGYTLDSNKYKYSFSYKDENTKVIAKTETVSNTVQKAPFEVIKISTNSNSTAKPIEGAEFTAILTKYVDYYGSFNEALKHLEQYADDEYSVFTTGSNGHRYI